MQTGKILLLFILLSSVSFTLSNLWEIRTIDDQPYANVILNRLSADTLFVNSQGQTLPIFVNNISLMIRKGSGRSRALPGMMIGLFGGGIISNVISRSLARGQDGLYDDVPDGVNIFFGTLLGITIGGIAGTAIGASLNSDKYYDLTTRKGHQKIELIRQLLDDKSSARPTSDRQS